ncbi:MAG TPA: hypothetical protein PKO15_01770 [Fibrobacteria bacterium]|nr:hypothetical protein [Fibrobacteria bacterium]HOX49839.1 hypothetical protein [Fibrobacteria bacterium]
MNRFWYQGGSQDCLRKVASSGEMPSSDTLPLSSRKGLVMSWKVSERV